MRYSFLLLLSFQLFFANAQKKDTQYITQKNVNTTVLCEGTQRCIVYFKMKKDATCTQTQFWTRKIERTTQNEKPVIIVTQEWEDKDSIMHTVKSVCNGITMLPVIHDFWWKQRGSTAGNFETKTIQFNGSTLSGSAELIGA
jgi:hypothetical protein